MLECHLNSSGKMDKFPNRILAAFQENTNGIQAEFRTSCGTYRQGKKVGLWQNFEKESSRVPPQHSTRIPLKFHPKIRIKYRWNSGVNSTGSPVLFFLRQRFKITAILQAAELICHHRRKRISLSKWQAY